MADEPAVEPFPWEFLLGFLLSQIRLSPDAFWALSMPEVSALLSHHAQKSSPRRSPINRDTLSDLMKQFPDGAAV